MVLFLKLCLFFGSMGLLSTCAPFTASPYSDQIIRPERVINLNSMKAISARSNDAKLTLAVLSDSHQNYKDLDRVIANINLTPAVDFVVNLGDFTNSGYNMEYDQFLASIVNFKFPFISVIGNHDSIGAGPSLFKKAFGDLNSVLDYDGYRFIFFNTSDLEIPEFFEPEWLLDRVNETTLKVIIFSHIALDNRERFKNSTAIFNQVIADSKVKLLLNGHDHVFSFRTISGTPVVQVARVEGRQWVKIEITGNNMTITDQANGSVTGVVLKP